MIKPQADKPANRQYSVEPSEFHHAKSKNLFVGTWLGELPAPFPKNYQLGVDTQQLDFEHDGWPLARPVALLQLVVLLFVLYSAEIKVPLGMWLFG